MHVVEHHRLKQLRSLEGTDSATTPVPDWTS
jgi:hypothetical protein